MTLRWKSFLTDEINWLCANERLCGHCEAPFASTMGIQIGLSCWIIVPSPHVPSSNSTALFSLAYPKEELTFFPSVMDDGRRVPDARICGSEQRVLIYHSHTISELQVLLKSVSSRRKFDIQRCIPRH